MFYSGIRISTSQMIVGMTLSFCLSIFITNISASGPRFDNRDEVIHNQFAILKGDAHTIRGISTHLPQFQSRILFPLLLKGISGLQFLETRQSYIVLRILTAFLAFTMFFLTSMKLSRNDVITVSLGMALLAYGLVFTFNHPWEHPTDFIDVFFYSLFFLFIVRKQRIALTTVVLLGTLNHQTAAFAGVMWLVVYGVKNDATIDLPESVFAIVLMAASYMLSLIVQLALGYGFSMEYVFNGYLTIYQFLEFLHNPNPYGWPIMLLAMHVPLAVWMIRNRREMDSYEIKIFVSVICVIVISTPIAFWSELRSVFLGPYVIMTLLAVLVHAKSCRESRV